MATKDTLISLDILTDDHSHVNHGWTVMQGISSSRTHTWWMLWFVRGTLLPGASPGCGADPLLMGQAEVGFILIMCNSLR